MDKIPSVLIRLTLQPLGMDIYLDIPCLLPSRISQSDREENMVKYHLIEYMLREAPVHASADQKAK